MMTTTHLRTAAPPLVNMFAFFLSSFPASSLLHLSLPLQHDRRNAWTALMVPRCTNMALGAHAWLK